jgi:hypothetical protein
MKRARAITLGVAGAMLATLLFGACASSPRPEATTSEREADTDAAAALEREADRPPRVTPPRGPQSR